MDEQILKAIQEAIEAQKTKLMGIGERLVTPFTEEDLLQPFDYPVLMRDPEFLYEEGILHGQLEILTLLHSCLVQQVVE